MKKASGILFTLLLVVSFVGLLPVPFIAPVTAQPNHVVINEFQAKGSEWIELYNPTGGVVSTVGWQIGDGEANETIDGDHGILSIGAGAYVWFYTTLGLANSYDQIFLYNDSDDIVDDVYYGYSSAMMGGRGGCPIGWDTIGFDELAWSSARAPNGVDTDSDAHDWTIDISATPGSANDAPAPNLGGEGVIINEFLHENVGATDNRSVELYNPTGTVVNVTYWWMTDDCDSPIFNITELTLIGPGALVVINDTTLWPSYDIFSLFTDTHVRADQVGLYSPSTAGESWQRGPNDGQGPNDGYNVQTSGYPSNWNMLPHTLGLSNTPGFVSALMIDVDDMTVTATASWVWTVAVEDIGGSPAPGLTVTAEHAIFNTTTFTQFPGTPVDQGDGNYTFTHDISTFGGSYHLRVNASLGASDPSTETVTLSVIGTETIIVRWDANHSQYSGHLAGGLVDGTQDVWRSFPDCVLIQTDQPFSASYFATTDILIVPYIQSSLTSTEMTALDNFIQNGGLVWWGGYYNMFYFNHSMNNEWISNYGFEFLNGTQTFDTEVPIRDATNNTSSNETYPTFWTFPNLHQLLNSITELSISGTTQVDVDPLSVNTTILATGDSFDTYWDADGDGTNNFGDINGTNCVPLAIYEPGTGGALIVSGSSNMLYQFDLAVGKTQFWRNMYDYRYSTRLGMTYSIIPDSIDVDLAVSNRFSFTVTVEAAGSKSLMNVEIALTIPTELTLVVGTNPTIVGDIAPGNSVDTTFELDATVDGNYTITITISADGIPDIIDQADVQVSTSIILPPPFPLEWLLIIAAVIIIVIIIIVVICIVRRR